MQGTYSAEHALPINELLTVVLLSHNRPAFLRRAALFYSKLPYKVLVLDSTAEATDGIAGKYDCVEYQHLPEYGYWEIQAKLRYGANQVKTPYMVFAADDDFLMDTGVAESLQFLENNPDYGFCHGYCLMYLTHGNNVALYRRDKKVQEDFGSDDPQQRVLDFMNNFIPPFYSVCRTQLYRQWCEAVPEGTGFEWAEIGHAYFLLANAKARILPIPYIFREVNYMISEHNTDVATKLFPSDTKTILERDEFARVMAAMPTQIKGLTAKEGKRFVMDCFSAMADCFAKGSSLTAEPIITSAWLSPFKGPERYFGPKQYVEMPFYNQTFFDKLIDIEFLLHALPAGRIQLLETEGIWLSQELMLREHASDTTETITARLWRALDQSPFNKRVVARLGENLTQLGEAEEAQVMVDWLARLEALSVTDRRVDLNRLPSGRLLNWLEARGPDAAHVALIDQHLGARQQDPLITLLVLDLGDEIAKLQTTLDSLVEGPFKAFRIVVFTSGTPPTATTADNVLHFVKVSKNNYVEKINLAVRQAPCPWTLLVEAGDEFTHAGLLNASLELQSAGDCRAVSADEIHRQASGAWTDVFRPGFNLDLLQSLPSLMARHWLIRKDVLLEAGGYSADFAEALEFELLLRIIQTGGLAWLAHLDEPLLICNAPAMVENKSERLALMRHFGRLGYKAQINSEIPGTYQIDYRHVERPQVSVIVRSRDNLKTLQACLTRVISRTRYRNLEVLIADDHSQSPEMASWLALQEQGQGRVRLVRNEEALNSSAFLNKVVARAKGDYVVFLSEDSEIMNPNWVELLLNHAQRPEVGAVGAKLTDAKGTITQAGLILGMNGGVDSAFVGEDKDAVGYMHRLVVDQNYSAVSDACLMVSKELFQAVGGFDEGDFAQAYRDVDLCLKLGSAGYLTVWTPKVDVIHPGTLPNAAEALAALREKWSAQFAHDLAYNRNHQLSGKGFTLTAPSSIEWSKLVV